MRRMRLIGLDTSGEICSVALWLDGTVRERAFPAAQSHGEHLLPMLRALLDAEGLDLKDFSGIAVAHGPGSFTGVRLACGVAQGLAYGAALPIATVGTLEALAEIAATARVLSCLDARMHEVYWAAYRRSANAWLEVSPPQVTPPAAIEVPRDEVWTGIGGGFVAYPELVSRLDPAVQPAPNLQPALAGAVTRLAASRWQELAAAPERAQPLYVRNKVALTTVERALEGWR